MKQVLRAVFFFTLLGALYGVAAAQSGSLTTTFAGGNSFSGNMFDLQASTCATLTGFDVNVGSGAHTIEVYFREGGYAGAETNAGAWTLLGRANVTSAGNNTPTSVPIGGLSLQPNVNYGIYVTTTGTTMNYTNGANVYDNGTLRLTTGVGKSYPFGSTFDPRTWNGTIYYDLCRTDGINDGRINRFDLAAPVAVYADNVDGKPGLVIYDTYSMNTILLRVSPEEIAATDGVTENTLIASDENGRVAVYRLADGTYQVNAPLPNGKIHVLIFSTIMPNASHTSFELSG